MVEALHQELRYSHPDNKIHLMNVSPFIIDTGMVKGASIRFPSEFAVTIQKKISLLEFPAKASLSHG